MVSFSLWRDMEETWAAALRRGDKVSVKIEVEWPPGAKRPITFYVDYYIKDIVTGKSSKITQEFQILNCKENFNDS